MAIAHRSTISPISLMLTQVQQLRLEAAARYTGVRTETFATNCLMGVAKGIEASEQLERRLLILLLSGSSWEQISKALDVSVEQLHRAGTIIAGQLFRGDRHL